MKQLKPRINRTGLSALVFALALAWVPLAGAQSLQFTTGTAEAPLLNRISAGPGAAVSGAGELHVFARGTPDGLWHLWWERGAWQGPENLGGGLVGGPAVAALSNNRMEVFVRGSNDALFRRRWDGSRWLDWDQLSPAGVLTSDPAVAVRDGDKVDVFARGNPDGLYHLWMEGGVLKGKENLDGGLVGGPAAASLNSNSLDVFVRGGNDALFRKHWEGTWQEWEQVGPAGAISSDPAVVAWNGQLHVFARGIQDGLWHMWLEGGTWKGPENLGGGLLDGPAVTALNNNSLDVFVRGTKDELFQKRWEGAWKEWVRLTSVELISTLNLSPPQTQPGIITEVTTIQTLDVNIASYEEIMKQLREEEQNVALRIINTTGLNEVFQLSDLTYFMIDKFNAANPGRERNRNTWRQALLAGDTHAIAYTVPLLVELAKYILDRNPVTWSNEEGAYIAFLQKLVQQQRYLSATRAQQLFLEWRAKEAEKYGGNLLTLAGTGLHPPAEYLTLAEYGYFVDSQYADSFAKIMTAASGAAAATGVGLGLALSGAGASIAASATSVYAGAAFFAGGTQGLGAGAAFVGSGPAVVVTLMITVGIIKAIEVAEYDAYVARLDAALASSRNPTSTDALRQLLSKDEGLSALSTWLLCHAATGPVATSTSYSSLFTEESNPWAPMPGAARDIGVGANGAVWVIGTAARAGGYAIYRWEGNNWAEVPGGAVVIAVDPQGNAWVANSQQQIFRYQNGQWVAVAGEAQDIAIGANGAVWHIGNDPSPGGFGIYKWNGNGWTKFSGAGVRMAVDPQGNPWVVAQDGGIHRHDGNQWHKLSGAATDIGVSAEGKVWVVGTNAVGNGFGVHTWNGQDGWIMVPGSLKGIAVGAGKPYGIGPNGEILQMP